MRLLSINGRIAVFTLGLLLSLAVMIWLEKQGVRREVISVGLLVITVLIYACIGVTCRTAMPQQYYAAGRSITPVYNGMACAADWMSAASFVSLVGTMYAMGYVAAALLVGWTGGFCLLTFLVAPHLRRTGDLTLPDYFDRRYGGRWAGWLATASVLACCFVYVVAQIYAVGLISSRILGVDFVLGISLGLGSVLLCSFLGGMRAITWTQVVQYVVMLVAVLVLMLSLLVKQGGWSMPWATYVSHIERLSVLEQRLASDHAEQQVRQILARERTQLAEYLQFPAAAIAIEKQGLERQLAELKASNASAYQIVSVERQLRWLSTDSARVIDKWQAKYTATAQRLQDLQGEQSMLTRSTSQAKKMDFLHLMAWVLVLSLGTASMPHLLMRLQTTPSVAATRSSAAWSLCFILLLYLCIPVLAVSVKIEMMTQLVGLPMDSLPVWLRQWGRVMPELVKFQDINGDGLLQWSELLLASDAILLTLPELAGLPFALTALVAAGALAAALSTADGLLLAMTAVLSRNLMPEQHHSLSSPEHKQPRSLISAKLILLLITLLASYVAAQRPEGIVSLVTTAFSLAAASLFAPLIMGIFWRPANRYGVMVGMVTGSLLAIGGQFAPFMPNIFLGYDPILFCLLGCVISACLIFVVSIMTKNLHSKS